MDNFKAFYVANKDKLFSYLMRMTGDYHLSSDLMQESFTRCLESYGGGEPNVALLFAIARNALFDNSRKRKNDVPFEADCRDPEDPHEHTLMVREDYRRVLSAMKRLEKAERDILALVITGELSYKEIGSIVGMSESNVKVRIHRARAKLKKTLVGGDA